MSKKFTLSPDLKELVEVATMEEPKRKDFYIDSHTRFLQKDFDEAVGAYGIYLRSRLRYQASGFTPEDAGKELVEGRDFEVENWCNNVETLKGVETFVQKTTIENFTPAGCKCCHLIAVPIPAAEGEGWRPKINSFFASIEEAHKEYINSPNLFRYIQFLDNYIDEISQPSASPAAPDKGEGVKRVRPWPLLGYAPGNYMNTCGDCKKEMTGVDKLCFQCLECAAISANKIMIKSLQPPAPSYPEGFIHWALSSQLWYDDEYFLWNEPDFDKEIWLTENPWFIGDQFRYTTAELFAGPYQEHLNH